jgi:hypothetical protein
MKINFYNGAEPELQIKPGTESAYVHPYVIMADTVYFSSIISTSMLIYMSVDSFPEELVIKMCETMLADNPEDAQNVAGVIEQLPFIKNLRKMKHKDKNVLVAMMTFKKIINLLRGSLKERFAELNRNHSLMELIPFVENDILQISDSVDWQNPEHEDKLLTEIANDIMEREITLSLDDSVETLFTPCNNQPINDDTGDFIKVPLWSFPPFIGLTYDQLKYTREQMHNVLGVFKIKLRELQNELFRIPYKPENFKRIKQMSCEFIEPLVAKTQQAIDESLYLNMIKNQLPGNVGLKFILGIAPASLIIDFYEKNKVLKPYAITELKQRASREINLNDTYVFTYFEVHV